MKGEADEVAELVGRQLITPDGRWLLAGTVEFRSKKKHRQIGTDDPAETRVRGRTPSVQPSVCERRIQNSSRCLELLQVARREVDPSSDARRSFHLFRCWKGTLTS